MNSQQRGPRPAVNGSMPHPPFSTRRLPPADDRRSQRIALTLPLLGRLSLPPPEQMAYYAGIGALVALEVLDWPAALVLGVGHALITQQRNPTLHEFAEALEDVERG